MIHSHQKNFKIMCESIGILPPNCSIVMFNNLIGLFHNSVLLGYLDSPSHIMEQFSRDFQRVLQRRRDNFEPKRCFRWVFSLDGISPYSYSTKIVSYNISGTEFPFIQAESYRDRGKLNLNVGKLNWDTISISLYDPLDQCSAEHILKWLRASKEFLYGQSTSYAGFSKQDIQIKVLNPIGDTVQHWNLDGAFLTSIKGKLDYQCSSEPKIFLTLRPGQITVAGEVEVEE